MIPRRQVRLDGSKRQSSYVARASCTNIHSMNDKAWKRQTWWVCTKITSPQGAEKMCRQKSCVSLAVLFFAALLPSLVLYWWYLSICNWNSAEQISKLPLVLADVAVSALVVLFITRWHDTMWCDVCSRLISPMKWRKSLMWSTPHNMTLYAWLRAKIEAIHRLLPFIAHTNLFVWEPFFHPPELTHIYIQIELLLIDLECVIDVTRVGISKKVGLKKRLSNQALEANTCWAFKQAWVIHSPSFKQYFSSERFLSIISVW